MELLSGPYTDPADAGSLPEELDPFPELQLGNPQGVSSVDESAQSHQSVHHQQPSQPPPPPPPLPEDIQADSLRYTPISIFKPIFNIDNFNFYKKFFFSNNMTRKLYLYIINILCY